MLSQEARWDLQYEELRHFMEEKKRRPSKNIGKERRLRNWMKYNKKCIVNGTMPENRKERFEKLLSLADDVRRLNQYAYGHPCNERQNRATQLELFS
ncbi:MAG: hypothetical protein IJ841_08030 [Prevotella sp.]|nr:hypothetical protein [Prevotella sp.]